jgi:hypothetical protein
MNERNRNVDLDTYARQASAGLRQSVRDAELTTTAPRPAGGRRLVAVAVALVVLVGGFVVLTRGGDEPSEGGIASSGVATPLAPDPVPEGLAFTGAFEGPIDDEEEASLPSDVAVYTDSDVGSESDVALVALSAEGTANYDGSALEPIEFEGRTFYGESQADGEAISWDDPVSGRAGIVSSRTLSREQLLDAARGATIDGRGVVEITAAALPDGLSLLATVPYGAVAPLGSAMAIVDGAGGIGYADAEQTRVLQVSFVLAGEGWLEASQALLYEPESLEVRGRPAYGGLVSPEATGATLTWVEADGTFVRLTGYGIMLDELADIAETLEPLSPEAWQALLDESDRERARSNGEATSGTEVVTATTFEAIGDPIEPNSFIPILAFRPADSPSGAASVSVLGEPDTAMIITPEQMPAIVHQRYNERFVYGVVPADTERLLVRYAGEEFEVTSFQNISGGGVFPAWAFVVGVHELSDSYELTAIGEDGSEITVAG